jgi:hypothetical protein
MSTVDQETRNEAVVRRAVEEMSNQRNAALVDELYTPSYVEHPLWRVPRTGFIVWWN